MTEIPYICYSGNQMKKISFFVLISLLNAFCFGQEEEENETAPRRKSEVGVDGFVNASSLGGSFGFGLKYAMVHKENYVFGPSFRYQRVWSNGIGGQKYFFNILGGGGFFHYRLNNMLFAGVELEFMKSPISYSYIYSAKKLVPTCFVGAGYSHEFEGIGMRLNAGVFYDIIDNYNSPFRASYIVKVNTAENGSGGTLLPIIYRIGFFFPLN